uniref:Uncharacterized protein n=1 Tax=Tetraselmis sp. GSL018 TaxID=582737 RepID=A0A061RPK4_9CHLO|mmetsp:Transcript_6231/g.14962  ORF Transcript_6231/g.14962 Transcript_6231/m.14962 type:complete len:104 (-) Transcript_6231:66-377(-)
MESSGYISGQKSVNCGEPSEFCGHRRGGMETTIRGKMSTDARVQAIKAENSARFIAAVCVIQVKFRQKLEKRRQLEQATAHNRAKLRSMRKKSKLDLMNRKAF